MREHVYRKFPNYIEAIQARLQKDATFREICADYEEMCTWLDDYCRSQGRSSEKCDIASEVIRELEDEINQKLKENP
jgi:ABC-type oligopeptide transport system substrate-binding subunit